jgi:hypothetical protein
VAIVRASCVRCGDVEFPCPDVQVRVSAPDGSGTFTYCCPGCHAIRVRPAGATTLQRLLRAGSVRVPDELPAELAERPQDLPPITHDELLELRRLLQGDDEEWLSLLTAAD